MDYREGAVVLLMGIVIVMCGCTGPNTQTVFGMDLVVGEWNSADEMGGFTSSMDVEEDHDGTATIYYVNVIYNDDQDNPYHVSWQEATGDAEYHDFTFDGTHEDGSAFEFEMTSKTDQGFDFTMDCDLNGDEDKLHCDGHGGGWQLYDFEWVLEGD